MYSIYGLNARYTIMRIARTFLLCLSLIFGLLFAWILLPGFYYAAQDGYLWTKEFAINAVMYCVGLTVCTYTFIRYINSERRRA
jgi:uncharacterized membrane protein YqjE